MELFFLCLQIIFSIEGGWYSGDGGTNYGIRAATLYTANKRGIVEETDIRKITRSDAAKIYYRMYWLPSGAGKLKWPLCLVVFDAAVHAGVGKARELLIYAIRAQIQISRLNREENNTRLIHEKQKKHEIRINKESVAVRMVVERWKHLKSLSKFPRYPGWRKRMQTILFHILEKS